MHPQAVIGTSITGTVQAITREINRLSELKESILGSAKKAGLIRSDGTVDGSAQPAMVEPTTSAGKVWNAFFAGSGPMPLDQIVEITGLPKPTVAYHVQKLRKNKTVKKLGGGSKSRWILR